MPAPGHELLIAAGANAHLIQPLSGLSHLHHLAKPASPLRRHVRYIHLPVLSHLRVHGPAIDYVGLFLLSIVSGLGINGFGEAALIAAAVYVANHHIPLEPVILIAAAGGFVGGIGSFLAGRHGGRSIFTAPGPLARARRGMLQHSESVYLKHDTLAILMTPGWAAGMHSVRWRKFVLLDVVSALVWAGLLGLGGYYLGGRITTEFDDEFGWVLGGVVAALVVYFVVRRALRAPSQRPGG